MSLTIGDTTDRLYALAQTAVASVTVGGQPMVAVDGVPTELVPGMFVVGLAEPPSEAGVTADTSGSGLALRTMGIGGLQFAEDYTIPAYIDIRIPGETVQKTARDQALAVFAAFWALFVADMDPTVTGSLASILPGGRPEIGQVISTPGNLGTATEPGRRHFISFGVRCTGLHT